MDFIPVQWKWKISMNHRYLKVNILKDNEERVTDAWYELVNDSRNEYKRIIANPGINELQIIGIVGQLSKNKYLNIGGKEVRQGQAEERQNENKVAQEQKYPEEIENAIINRQAVAAVDASVEENYMVAFWIITTVENQVYETGEVTSSKWAIGQTPVAEGIGVLNLVKDINNKTQHLASGEITVYTDMKKVVKEVYKNIKKESQCLQEASATILGIKKEINEAKITIKIEYSNAKVRQGEEFANRPGPFLLDECDK